MNNVIRINLIRITLVCQVCSKYSAPCSPQRLIEVWDEYVPVRPFLLNPADLPRRLPFLIVIAAEKQLLVGSTTDVVALAAIVTVLPAVPLPGLLLLLLLLLGLRAHDPERRPRRRPRRSPLPFPARLLLLLQLADLATRVVDFSPAGVVEFREADPFAPLAHRRRAEVVAVLETAAGDGQAGLHATAVASPSPGIRSGQFRRHPVLGLRVVLGGRKIWGSGRRGSVVAARADSSRVVGRGHALRLALRLDVEAGGHCNEKKISNWRGSASRTLSRADMFLLSCRDWRAEEMAMKAPPSRKRWRLRMCSLPATLEK